MNTYANETVAPSSLDEDEIRQYAYHLYEESGRAPGRDLENWLNAESRLRDLLAWRPPSPPAGERKTRSRPASGAGQGHRSRRAVVDWGGRHENHAPGLKSGRARVH